MMIAMILVMVMPTMMMVITMIVMILLRFVQKVVEWYRVFFFTGPPRKKLKYGKPRLGKVRCIKDVLDTPNLA